MGKNNANVNANLYDEFSKKAWGKKSLIIVCDEKTVKYGNYLGQLISTNDDNEDGVVGVADGTVVAAVWTEKEYKANKVRIPFSQHVVFLGENKISKEEITSIPVLFDEYGMRYGWLGTRAKVLVSKRALSDQRYAEFVLFCLSYQTKLENAIMKTNIGGMDLKELEKHKDDYEKPDGPALAAAKRKTERVQAVKKNLWVLGLPRIPIVGTQATVVKVSTDIVKELKEVTDQQYRALTAIFYLEGLQKFLEG